MGFSLDGKVAYSYQQLIRHCLNMSCFFAAHSQSTEAEQKQEILDWIGAVTGETIPKDTFEKVLKDGVLLAKYI